ncbi:MAG: hypothetical protein ACRDRO_02885 [Pseudonocardiaceae bacterium]
MSQFISKTGSARLEPDVLRVVGEVCTSERRSLSNAVNLLVIEALKARGLWTDQQSAS